jgi:Ice-binding-like
VGQASQESEAAFPTDWTHHQLIFSKPATAEQAKRVEQDPRYWQQMARHSPTTLREPETGGVRVPELRPGSRAVSGEKPKIKKDWTQDLGSGASVGAGNYPAKYSFRATSANCPGAAQPDFVVYGTGLAGSNSQATILAYDNLYSGCIINLGTAANFAILAASTVGNTGNSVVTGGDIGVSPGTGLTGFPPGILTPPAVKLVGGTVAAQAQADANTAFHYYQGLTGATPITTLNGQTFVPGLYNAATSLALAFGQTVTLDGGGTYIFQIGSSLDIAGTVALTGGAAPGNVIWLVGTSATLEGTGVAAGDIVANASITLNGGASLAGRAIALSGAVTMTDNAVTTVDTEETVPSVYWAYDTGGAATTSPVLSSDGTSIAFVQLDSGSTSSLVLLKWAESGTETVGSPNTLTRTAPLSYLACTAPCMTTLPILSGPGAEEKDSSSSVFYDYGEDTAYVGDDAGWLHKFHPVFLGKPAEVITGWPVQVNPGSPTALTSPVYDSTSRYVFVADTGGYLYRVSSSSTPVVTKSAQLDFSEADDGGPGIVQGPIVDSTSGLVYVFATSDGTTSCIGSTACTAVYQLRVGFLAGRAGTKAVVGASTRSDTKPSPLYIGALDSTYENSGDATGNLYVCGNTGGDPILYQVPVTAAGFGTVSAGPVLSTSFAQTPCSPVTDIFNPNVAGGATEWIFASAESDGISSACAAGGCVFNFEDTPWQPKTTYTVGQEVVDSHFQIHAVGVAGESGALPPTWSMTVGDPTGDGTVTWVDQGVQSAITPAAWAAGTAYSAGDLILDSNLNLEFCLSVFPPGTSGGSPPAWNTTPGSATGDSLVTWRNVGAIATAALTATGGTSGIVMDNTVGSLAGASQIYFSTLNGGCGGTDDADGCAVQASQSALQ